ncbi:uncharacterized protein J3R85_018584 [Psidium guajava]|nr:uncharacterized protein J3R85_018584 [Psidium guajava]
MERASREQWPQWLSRVSYFVRALNFRRTWIYKESTTRSRARLNRVSFLKADDSNRKSSQGSNNNGSPGTIPPSLASSTELVLLNLSFNSIYGPITRAITGSASITTLASTTTSVDQSQPP